MKHIVTQEELDLNPELIEAGVQVGDEIDLPESDLPESEEIEEAEVIEEESQGGDLNVKI